MLKGRQALAVDMTARMAAAKRFSGRGENRDPKGEVMQSNAVLAFASKAFLARIEKGKTTRAYP
jgi:hypothetical protein